MPNGKSDEDDLKEPFVFSDSLISWQEVAEEIQDFCDI